MKTWKDIKPGDKIYYYDHGKIHEQLVYEVEDKIDVRKYQGYGGTVTTHETPYRNIVAGKNRRTNLQIYNEWNLKYSSCRFHGMPRFADKEKAKKFINERIDYCKEKINYFKRQEKKYTKMMNHYDLPA